jgi:signal transduction histidine kinase/ligand-binding sensor domain-containing protein
VPDDAHHRTGKTTICLRFLVSRFKLFCSSDVPTLSLCLICLILLASGDHALGTSNSFHHYREAGTDGKESRLSGLLTHSPGHEKNRVFEEAGARPHEFQSSDLHRGAGDRLSNLAFTHLTTDDGLSQGYITVILQDRRGFMWFATRDGLNRYDGNSFVVYKNKPNDPDSLSSNFIQDLMEDNQGYLWIATDTGVDKFDPTTDRFTRYLHEPSNPDSISGTWVTSVVEDTRGYLWFGTFDSGLDRFDSATGKFSHFQKDNEDHFVGRITQVIEGRQGAIWFVGERGLFHVSPQTGQITRPLAIKNRLSVDSVYEDDIGNLWLLASSPSVELVKYDRRGERVTTFPLRAHAVGVLASTENGGSANGRLVADGQSGFWVPSSLGLSYFDRQTNRFTYRFQHDDTDPSSLDSNAIMSVYQDRGGVLWVGTENTGINILDRQQEQFARYRHRPGDPDSLSPGRVKAIYQGPDGILWAGLFPRALDQIDRNTGKIIHYVPKLGKENGLGEGTNVNSIYQDEAGYLWVGGGGGGLDRLDKRTGRFKHYRHDPGNPKSLISNNVYTIYGDRDGHIWVGQEGGISRFDPVADGFINYRPVPDSPNSFTNTVWTIYQDRSGTLWFGTWGGSLVRFDDKAKNFVNYAPDSRDPNKLNGGGINAIHEDLTGVLWVGTFDGLYRYNRQSGTFTRYTESQGLPSSTIRCILEDRGGRLWLSTQKGISRFDSRRDFFRNYDVFDGLQTNEFSTGCYQGRDGEIFFGGSNGFNAFSPENIRDNPYVPPVVITSFKIFNKPVPISAKSPLKKGIPYVNSLTLSHRDSVFSFEFAALSYANSRKNRYRYRLEGLEPDWNEVDSKQRLATYTNLDPGKYVFRVQGSNCDGVWNEEGVSLPIVITPPWWNTGLFRALSVAAFLGLLWAVYQLRIRQLHKQFEMALEVRVGERARIARELHDTLLQSFHGVLLYFQTGINQLPEHPGEARTAEARKTLEKAMHQAKHAIVEGREAIQGLRSSVVETNDLALAMRTLGEELSASANSTAFEVHVEGTPRDLHPILRDEVYRITGEGIRNAFRHAEAKQIEVEIHYDDRRLRVRIRDDGKGIDPKLLSDDGREGHFGLRGMRERAKLIGGKLTVWSELDAGTEVELSIPAARAYTAPSEGQPMRLTDKIFTKLTGRGTVKKS